MLLAGAGVRAADVVIPTTIYAGDLSKKLCKSIIHPSREPSITMQTHLARVDRSARARLIPSLLRVRAALLAGCWPSSSLAHHSCVDLELIGPAWQVAQLSVRAELPRSRSRDLAWERALCADALLHSIMWCLAWAEEPVLRLLIEHMLCLMRYFEARVLSPRAQANYAVYTGLVLDVFSFISSYAHGVDDRRPRYMTLGAREQSTTIRKQMQKSRFRSTRSTSYSGLSLLLADRSLWPELILPTIRELAWERRG